MTRVIAILDEIEEENEGLETGLMSGIETTEVGRSK